MIRVWVVLGFGIGSGLQYIGLLSRLGLRFNSKVLGSG